MGIKAPIPKENHFVAVPQIFVGGVNYFFGWWEVGKFSFGGDIQTYRQTYGQGITCHLSHISAVQCSAVLQYSAGQSCSRLVHQKTEKMKNRRRKKSWKRKEGKNKKCVITGQN